jgi:hypothetical protein
VVFMVFRGERSRAPLMNQQYRRMAPSGPIVTKLYKGRSRPRRRSGGRSSSEHWEPQSLGMVGRTPDADH